MIKMQIIGFLGKDAEVHIHETEACINFNIAHTDKYKDVNGAIVHKTTWVSCSWWTEKHNIAQYLKKGVQAWVEGIPEAKMWKKRGTDENQCGLNCRVYSLQLLGGRREEGQQSNQQAQQQSQPQQNFTGYKPVESDISDGDDSLPF